MKKKKAEKKEEKKEEKKKKLLREVIGDTESPERLLDSNTTVISNLNG